MKKFLYTLVALEMINDFLDNRNSPFIRTPGYELPLWK